MWRYFTGTTKITQENYSIPDPARPGFILNLGTVKAHGLEFEFNARLTRNLVFIGNYAETRANDTFGREIRSTPDNSAAALLRYSFRDGSLKGLSLTARSTFIGSRPGDAPGVITGLPSTVNGRTLTGLPVKPTFYLDSYTLFSVGATYDAARWSLALQVENILDKDYILSSSSRSIVYPGAPRNLKGSFTWRF